MRQCGCGALIGALIGAVVAVGVAPPPQAARAAVATVAVASVRNRRRESAPDAGELLHVMRDPFVSPPTVSYRVGGSSARHCVIIPPRVTMSRRTSGASPDISVSHASVYLR